MTMNAAGLVRSSFATQYRRYDRMLARFGRRMLDAADIQPAQRIVDVGCGAGTMTLDVARRVGPRGRVVGIDSSPDVVEVARVRARERRLANVRFVVADATRHPFPVGRVDTIVSRVGSCGFPDAVTGYTNLGRALRPGGKLAFVCAREAQRNPWATVPFRAVRSVLPQLEGKGGVGPFGLADGERIHRVLSESGFSDVRVESIDEAVCLGEDIDDALEFFFETDGRVLSETLEDDTVRGVRAARESALAPFQGSWGVWMPASMWLVTAAA
jgi:ubiquinone/menaquinone biosynthesis C-methylase UbiE